MRLTTSNPALARGGVFDALADHADVATIPGVINKTAMLVAIALIGGMVGGTLVLSMPQLLWISAIAGFVVTLGVYFAIRSNPMRARRIAWFYALVEGFFLGALTITMDTMLESMGYAVAGGVALQAFVITMGVMLAMLGLYYARILKPTRTLQAVLSTLTLGIMVTYLISFALSFFGIQMPFLSIGSAFGGGTPALIGLGLNVAILGVASLWLIIDFGIIEAQVRDGAPKAMEWYGAFALIVTLAWIYYEAVKLVVRLAILLGHRR